MNIYFLGIIFAFVKIKLCIKPRSVVCIILYSIYNAGCSWWTLLRV